MTFVRRDATLKFYSKTRLYLPIREEKQTHYIVTETE